MINKKSSNQENQKNQGSDIWVMNCKIGEAKSNYKPIGKYIQLVDERNTAYEDLPLMGLSVSKEFFPTIANLVGTDMKTYKIVYRNQFTYIADTSRRGDKIAIALNDRFNKMLVSQAYIPFEVKDTNELDPEYLMMWFRRPEFDRYARFKSHGSAREIFDWEELCETLIPVPTITKQREIVKEYNVIQNRITLNQQLIQKLEETAQAIYKQWFVEFEFPYDLAMPEALEGRAINYSKGYKSNGGEMVWNEELEKEIPKHWEVKSLSKIATYLNGLAMQKFPADDETDYIPVLKIRELSQGCFDKNSDKGSKKTPAEYIIENGDVIFSWSGTLKVEIWCGGKGALNQHLFKVSSKKYPKWYYYLWTNYHLNEFIRIAAGKATSLGHIKREHLNEALVLAPSSFKKLNHIMEPFFENIILKKNQNQKLSELKDLLLSKLATVEN